MVVPMNPKLKDHELTYDVEILDGEMPDTGGECALFIDVIGRTVVTGFARGYEPADRRRDRRRRKRLDGPGNTIAQ